MDHFELVSEYKPTGDQPQAIADLSKASRKATSARPFSASLVPEDFYYGKRHPEAE